MQPDGGDVGGDESGSEAPDSESSSDTSSSDNEDDEEGNSLFFGPFAGASFAAKRAHWRQLLGAEVRVRAGYWLSLRREEAVQDRDAATLRSLRVRLPSKRATRGAFASTPHSKSPGGYWWDLSTTPT